MLQKTVEMFSALQEEATAMKGISTLKIAGKVSTEPGVGGFSEVAAYAEVSPTTAFPVLKGRSENHMRPETKAWVFDTVWALDHTPAGQGGTDSPQTTHQDAWNPNPGHCRLLLCPTDERGEVGHI